MKKIIFLLFVISLAFSQSPLPFACKFYDIYNFNCPKSETGKCLERHLIFNNLDVVYPYAPLYDSGCYPPQAIYTFNSLPNCSCNLDIRLNQYYCISKLIPETFIGNSCLDGLCCGKNDTQITVQQLKPSFGSLFNSTKQNLIEIKDVVKGFRYVRNAYLLFGVFTIWQVVVIGIVGSIIIGFSLYAIYKKYMIWKELRQKIDIQNATNKKTNQVQLEQLQKSKVEIKFEQK